MQNKVKTKKNGRTKNVFKSYASIDKEIKLEELYKKQSNEKLNLR